MIPDLIALVLVIIGGINWGLVGAFDFNLVEEIFGTGTFTDIIYILVGLAAIYTIYVAVTYPHTVLSRARH
jgi:uncharacterized membrane protein YuzA (DUF378 family)